MLGGSGHIAGVTNAPPNARYGHWTNNKLPDTAEEWLAGSVHSDESWWVDWDKWVRRLSGGRVAARYPDQNGNETLGPAPGTYIFQKH